ncbi:MAG: DUF2125 domain-containing protein [Pseudomonadota bacterium]
MRFILWVVVLAFLGWSGFWVLTARTIESTAGSWFDDRRIEGWAADFSALDVGGYPYRFDARFDDLALADPGTGVVWTMPEFELTALAYQPGHIIALFPEEQTLASPFNTLTVTNEDMRASARLSGTTLALQDSTMELAGVVATSTQGWEVTLDRALLAARAVPAVAHTYDLFLEANDLRPSDALRLGLDREGRLPATFETFKLDARVAFDAPWDRFAIERARPQPTQIELKTLETRWGQLELLGAGTLDIARDGTPEGTITVKATNWREIISIGQALGTIPASAVPSLTRGLEFLSALSGPSNTLDIPLSFMGGFVTVGPIPLGAAPKIRLR